MYIFLIFTVLVLNFFAFLYVIYIKTFYNNPVKHRKKNFKFKGQILEYKDRVKEIYNNISQSDYEQVFITNRSGLKLAARYYHKDDNAPLAIMFHGYKSHAMYDNGGGYEICSENNINVLIPDQRAHGESEGKCVCFGVSERFDCLDWVDYAIKRFGADIKIILVGVSMGAATVLMASGLGLPLNVKGIIADCGYSSPKDIIKKVIKDFKLPGFLVYPCVRLSGRMFGHFDIESASTVEAVKNAKLPIMLVHGEDDGFVPCDMSRQIQKACNGQLVTVPGADHGLSYIVDTNAYRNATVGFINTVI